MMIRDRILALFSILFAVCSLGAVCCEDSGEFDEAADRARLDSMRNHIQGLVGSADCSESAHCRNIAFGAKPCGGPWEYLIYSVTAADADELDDLVSEYNAFEGKLNKRYGWISDCSTPGLPQPVCRDGRCVDAGK